LGALADDRVADEAGAARATGATRATPKPARRSGRDRPRPPVAAPAMRAGRHDDNKQYNRFLSFLGDNSHMVVYPVDVSERLTIRTLDKAGKSLNSCSVEVKDLGGKSLARMTTHADGSTQFFPAAVAQEKDSDFTVRATCGRQTRNGQLSRAGRRDNELRFTFARAVPKKVPVDIAIVLDTTGSMQSQIDRLKKTLKAIHFQLTNLSTRPDIRFALVAYRDRGDDYVTQPYPFTRDVGAFQRIVDSLDADGGGDTPEDLQAALADAMNELDWRTDAVRVGFIVADAIPHTDYGQKYTYRSAMADSLARGIKWISVGAGGLPREGEVIFRQIAQYTMGEYVFITESGVGDHDGGIPGEASHHVGSNYTTENLDQAIVRIVRRELSYLTDTPKDFDDTIVATAKPGVPRDTVLAPAVAEVLRQLVDYSSLRLGDRTPVAVVPTTTQEDSARDVAGYISDQMVLFASRNPALKVVERDLQAISKELALQLSDLVNVEKAVPVGKMVGAELLIVSKLSLTEDGARLFAKLVRVETGEMLSVAKVDMAATVVDAS
jgi:Mg-chelatase subunit ChlD